MKRTLFTISVVITITAIILLSCKKEYSCEGCYTGNKPPIAVAGRDQLVTLPRDSVVLNGTASYDPDGQITAWHWTKIAGPAFFHISHKDSAKTTVGMLVPGIYHFQLSVTDDKGTSAKDTVQITVHPGGSNQPPVACAGQDQIITLPVNTMLLDGSCSSDPDNNITGYLWTKISGPSLFSIANATGIQTQVTNLVEGTYLFLLKVTDAGGLFSTDTIQVIVKKTTLVDIYVTGQQNGRAKYWKNGLEVLLSSPSSEAVATSIAVNGNDVYVSGEEGDFFMYSANRAKYWKNGQEVFLTGPTGAGTNSIAVVGSDVYVAGWEFYGSKTVAKYWKNQQAVSLTDGTMDAEATCIVIVNNDIYVAGHENGVAKYWKNGQPVSLTDGQRQAFARSIAIVGTDIYVAGSESNGSAHVAKYWKNGQVVTLTNGMAVHATANSIAVVGTDVYIAGWEGDFFGMLGGSGSVAKYWKNGQTISLTNGATYAYAASIAVLGSDIYVGGVEYNGPHSVPKYWKNGLGVPLSGSGAWVRSILVVP